MSYPDAVWERAMTVQQVILKALAARCIGTERRTFSGSRRAHSGAGGSGMRSTGILAGLWKLPVPWTPRTRPPHLGKRHKRVFHSYHRPLPNNRSNHLSNESGQITCQQHDRPGRSARPRGAPASAARCVLFIAVASGTPRCPVDRSRLHDRYLCDRRGCVLAPARPCSRCSARIARTVQTGVRKRIRQGYPRDLWASRENGDAPAPSAQRNHCDLDGSRRTDNRTGRHVSRGSLQGRPVPMGGVDSWRRSVLPVSAPRRESQRQTI